MSTRSKGGGKGGKGGGGKRGKPSLSPPATQLDTVKAQRSPGGTKVIDVTMRHKFPTPRDTARSSGGAGGGAGAAAGGGELSEAERLAQWKAQMAAQADSDDDQVSLTLPTA